MKIGGLNLNPKFSPSTTKYTAFTKNESDVINAKPASDKSDISIMLNDTTPIPNGTAATWNDGENKLDITVSESDDKSRSITGTVYTVAVTKGSLKSLDVTSEETDKLNETKITISSPKLSPNNTYKYKKGENVVDYAQNLSKWSNFDNSGMGVITGVETGDKITVAEVNVNTEALAAAIVTAKTKAEVLGSIDIESKAGEDVGTSEFKVTTPKINTSDVYKYKIGDHVNEITYNQDLTYWNNFNSSGKQIITVATGTDVTVVECTSDRKALAVGKATAVSKEPGIQVLAITSIEGSDAGTTNITITTSKLDESNTYVYKIGDYVNQVTYGQDLSTWLDFGDAQNNTISVKNGEFVTIAECTPDKKAVAIGKVTAESATFKAYINVTAVKDTVVTAVSGNNRYTETADNTGIAKITVENPGNYSINGTVNDVTSNTVTVNVTQHGNTYSTEISFITLTLTSPAESNIKITKDDINITKTSTGNDIFYLPNTGLYNVTITKGDESATANVDVTEYTNYELNLSYSHIYGATWNGSSSTSWTRTDDAKGFGECNPYYAGMSDTPYSPFDNLMPWSGMVIEKGRAGGDMVKIPKFWYKLTQNSDNPGMTIQIADSYVDGFSVSPAHMARFDGDHERDVVYVGRYHCINTYKSGAGTYPIVNRTRAESRTEISKLGDNIWQSDFAMRFTIWLLYIVEFANWNSQGKIGYGCGNNSATENMGYTNGMTYHTGTTKSSRSTYGLGTQYRYIEGLWDNVYDWCDGCYNNSKGFNIILNPNDFSDNANGTSVGIPSNGYPSKFSVKTEGGFPMFIPTAASGSESTYSCDYWYFVTSDPCVCVGGSYGWYTHRGLFYVSCNSVSNTDADIGCRLMELP